MMRSRSQSYVGHQRVLRKVLCVTFGNTRSNICMGVCMGSSTEHGAAALREGAPHGPGAVSIRVTVRDLRCSSRFPAGCLSRCFLLDLWMSRCFLPRSGSPATSPAPRQLRAVQRGGPRGDSDEAHRPRRRRRHACPLRGGPGPWAARVFGPGTHAHAPARLLQPLGLGQGPRRTQLLARTAAVSGDSPFISPLCPFISPSPSTLLGRSLRLRLTLPLRLRLRL
jgi:hypothetical protein